VKEREHGGLVRVQILEMITPLTFDRSLSLEKKSAFEIGPHDFGMNIALAANGRRIAQPS